jgi:hypothetical protein
MRTYVSITVYGLLALDAVEAATVTSQAWANHTVQRFPQAQSESDSTTSRPTTSMYTLPIAPQHKSSETQEVSISKSNATSGTWMSLPPKEPVTSESTSEWTWGTDFIPFTKPPCPVTRKCSEVCESWESCTKNLKTITSYTENISTMTSDIYVLEPWTEALVVTSTRSWVGPGAQYFIDDLA